MVLRLFRPFGVALGVFIFLNLLLVMQKPSLSATRIWLYLRLEEPLLSGLATVLGLALVLPHSLGRFPAVRLLTAGVFCGFLALAAANTASFYHRVKSGLVATSFPVPFSALIAVILCAESARVICWAPLEARLPAPARRFLAGAAVVGAFLLLILAHIITFGATDYSRLAHADAVVVLGARVYPDGTLSNALVDRMERALEIYWEGQAEGRAPRLILTGGVEPGGVSEPRAMAAYARRYDVPVSDLILDEKGVNTYHSAVNCGAIARARGFRKLVVVSQYYHNARVKLVFERVGTPCLTVPARYRALVREGYFLLREAVAFPFYLLYYHGAPAPPTASAGGG